MTGQHRAPSFLRRVFKVSGFRDVVSPGIPVGSSHRGVGSCPTNTSVPAQDSFRVLAAPLSGALGLTQTSAEEVMAPVSGMLTPPLPPLAQSLVAGPLSDHWAVTAPVPLLTQIEQMHR